MYNMYIIEILESSVPNNVIDQNCLQLSLKESCSMEFQPVKDVKKTSFGRC